MTIRAQCTCGLSNPNPRGWVSSRGSFVDLEEVVFCTPPHNNDVYARVLWRGRPEVERWDISAEDYASVVNALMIYRSGR